MRGIGKGQLQGPGSLWNQGLGNVPLVLEDGPSLADILWRKRGVNHLPNQDPGSITEYCNSTGGWRSPRFIDLVAFGGATDDQLASQAAPVLHFCTLVRNFGGDAPNFREPSNLTSFVERDPSLPDTGLTDSFTQAARRKVLLVARGCMLGSSGVSNLEAKFRPINIWQSDGSTHHASNTALMSCEALALLRTCQHPTTEFPKQS